MRPRAPHAALLLLAAAAPLLGVSACALFAGIEDVSRVDPSAEGGAPPDAGSEADTGPLADTGLDADTGFPLDDQDAGPLANPLPPIGAPTGTNGIAYNGGPVMTGTVRLYYIFYGDWHNNTATTILNDLGDSIGGSPYFAINATYLDGNGNHVSGEVQHSKSIVDNGSMGKTLDHTSVKAVVTRALNNGTLPSDEGGVYFVLTSAEVAESSSNPSTDGSFCGELGPAERGYCGYHDSMIVGGKVLKLAFVGNGARCPSACIPAVNRIRSPNGNPGADAMASVLARELSKTVTDPEPRTNPAWKNPPGSPLENGDLCAQSYGDDYPAPVKTNGRANVHLGDRDYLLQQNHINQLGGTCGLGISWASLGITLGSAPAVASRGDGHFDIAFASSSKSIQHTSFDSFNFKPTNVFLDNVPGKTIRAPTIVASSPNRLDVFASTLMGGYILWDQLTGGGEWAELTTLNDTMAYASPAAVSMAPNRIDLFTRGLNNSLYARTILDGAVLPWSDIMQGDFQDSPAAVSWGDNRIDVFVRGKDNGLYHRYFNGSWSSRYQALGGQIIDSPAVASSGPGHLDVFGRSPDNTLVHWRCADPTGRCYDDGTVNPWSAEESLGTPALSAPAAVANKAGRIDVFVKGEGNALWHRVGHEITGSEESWGTLIHKAASKTGRDHSALDSSTLPPMEMSGSGTASGAAATTALVVIWSRQEPDRIGEVLLLPSNDPGPWIFGRGTGGEQRRASLVRQRPGAIEKVGPLECPRISRAQLRLSVRAGEGLSVENLGACPLVHRGREVPRAEVAPGEVVELSNELLFLCVRREPIPPASMTDLDLPLHAFGEADAFGMVGESPAIGELRQRIAAAAPHPAHVLILGESGSGKELVARAIHARSSRGKRPIVARNAATIPEGIADAELFGNVRNYPNPGMPERPGLIGEAHQSTLFLDEFAELPPRLQAHLLRVMDEGEYQRLGDSTPRRADLRIVAATNRPPSAIKDDVLARLQIRLVVPDLNARREDIPLLARSLLRRRAAADARIAERFFPEGNPAATPRVSPGLMAALVEHRYTTHVRELDALLLGAALGSRGKYVELGAELRRDLESRAQPLRASDALAGFSPEERSRLLLLRQHLFRPTACGRDPAYPGNRQTADLHLRQLLCKALAVAEWNTARATVLLAGESSGELYAKARTRIITFLSNLRARLSSPAEEAALRRSLADEWKGTVEAALQVLEALRTGKIQGEGPSSVDAGGGAPPSEPT